MSDALSLTTPLTSALAANQLQRLLLVKYVSLSLKERLLNLYPKFEVQSERQNIPTAGHIRSQNEGSLTDSPVPLPIPEEEDFCSYLDAQYAREQQRQTEDDNPLKVVPPENLPLELWNEYVASQKSISVAKLHEATHAKGSVSHSPKELGSKLLEHHRNKWVPFHENHRGDGFASSPIAFLDALVERFEAWCGALGTAMIETSMREVTEDLATTLSGAVPEGPMLLTPYPAFAALHIPSAFAELSRSGFVDYSALRAELLPVTEASLETNQEPRRFAFGSLKCSSLMCPGNEAKKRPSRSKVIKNGKEATVSARRKLLLDAQDRHAHMTRVLWASTGGTKAARKKMSKGGKRRKSKASRRGRRKGDQEHSDEELEEEGSEEFDSAVEEDEAGLIFLGGVLTVSSGSRMGVDAGSIFSGELYVGEGHITLPR